MPSFRNTKARCLAQSQPTQRAPDWWESARFWAGFWLQAGSGKVAFSPPAHQRVTRAVETVEKVPFQK